ncbi:heavy-metal-associated domain-containing protein [Pseudorhodoferax sp.]|uniref:heavy-metal-associated domain-containing protein n=1 Tax=Pseudorhodoferax sp. TaxID=1993553 RepID=UPI002DD6249E|nr:heavy-metal-associated domain-containing protein [Pseudorhodoferax sp.]
MQVFDVKDMSCGHCVASITKAVQAADPQARVEIDLARHRVQVEPGRADAATIRQAIAAAGFTPEPVAG